MMTIRAADLAGLSPTERAQRIQELAQCTTRRPNGELDEVQGLIEAYERDRGLSSSDMQRMLAAGELREDELVCLWLLQLRRRDRLVEFAEAHSSTP